MNICLIGMQEYNNKLLFIIYSTVVKAGCAHHKDSDKTTLMPKQDLT